MAEQFYTILTAIGKAKIANSAALGEKVELTHLALGDGDGSYYNPTEDQTALKNEVWRGAIGTVDVDGENPNWIIIQTVVPSQHGGFMIREAGVFDDEGDLIAVGKYPETYKPVAADGSIKDLVIRMILEVSNTASVVLKVDPTVILATQQQVIEAETRAKTYTDQEVGKVDQKVDAHLADKAKYAKFTLNVNQSLPHGINTPVFYENKASYNDEDFCDIDANTGQIKITQNGVYEVCVAVRFASNADGERALVTDVGIVNTNALTAGKATSLMASYFVEATAGQHLKIEVYQNSGGALDLTTSGGAYIRQVVKS